MKQKDLFLGLDTETANSFQCEDGSTDLRDSLVYDIGWQIIDRQGNVYKKQSFIIKEIFCDEKEMMKNAYYAEKISQYWEDIKQKKRQIKSFYEVKKALYDDLIEYNIKAIFAHNARFDVNALNKTQRWLTKSKYRWFFPWSVEIWDTLKMARDTIGKQNKYNKFCIENNYLTKKDKPRLTAEILYRFITDDTTFIESHTGLEDVEIESKIFAYIFDKFHTDLRRLLYEKKGVE